MFGHRNLWIMLLAIAASPSLATGQTALRDSASSIAPPPPPALPRVRQYQLSVQIWQIKEESRNQVFEWLTDSESNDDGSVRTRHELLNDAGLSVFTNKLNDAGLATKLVGVELVTIAGRSAGLGRDAKDNKTREAAGRHDGHFVEATPTPLSSGKIRLVVNSRHDSAKDDADPVFVANTFDAWPEQTVAFAIDANAAERLIFITPIPVKPIFGNAAQLENKASIEEVVSTQPIDSEPPSKVQIKFARPTGMQVQLNKREAHLTVPARVNLNPGVHPLVVRNIPNMAGLTLYLTLEVSPADDRTRSYLAHNAVPIQLTAEDFDQVASGNFVTKVLYLPSPEHQETALAGVESLVSSRLDPGVSPLTEANRRGTVLAVLRMGNRDNELTDHVNPLLPASRASAPEKPPLKLIQGTAEQIEFPENVTKVLVGNPAIVKVTPLAPKRLQVTAHEAGSTKLTAHLQTGAIDTLEITVENDATHLSTTLKRLFPQEKIEAIGLPNGSVLLRGQVNSAAHSQQVVDIAEQFHTNVLNHMVVGQGGPLRPVLRAEPPATPNRPARVRQFSGDPVRKELQSLRNDIQTLRRDVKKIVELLESEQHNRAKDSDRDETRPPASATGAPDNQSQRLAWQRLGLKLSPFHNPKRGANPAAGMLVRDVAKLSSAKEAGIKTGDVLIGLANWEVTSHDDVKYALEETATEAQIPFTAARGDRMLNGTLHIRPSDVARLRVRMDGDRVAAAGAPTSETVDKYVDKLFRERKVTQLIVEIDDDFPNATKDKLLKNLGQLRALRNVVIESRNESPRRRSTLHDTNRLVEPREIVDAFLQAAGSARSDLARDFLTEAAKSSTLNYGSDFGGTCDYRILEQTKTDTSAEVLCLYRETPDAKLIATTRYLLVATPLGWRIRGARAFIGADETFEVDLEQLPQSIEKLDRKLRASSK